MESRKMGKARTWREHLSAISFFVPICLATGISVGSSYACRPCGWPSPSVEFCWSNMTQTRNNPMRHSTRVQSIGRFIVADPKVCHGKPTFRGTRVLVADVLEQVAAGLAWETIIDEWNGHLTQDAIREAVQLAREALLRHSSEFVFEPVPA